MSEVRRFWNHARSFNLPWADASRDSLHVPLALYGDSAKFSCLGDKITGVFMSMPLWNPRSSRFSRFLLYALETNYSLGGLTLNPLYAKIVDSLWKLYEEGLCIKGQQIRFATIEIRGDWEWHYSAFNLIPSWRSDQFCWRCAANKKDNNNFLDFGEDPGWHETERTHTEFLAECIPLRSAGGPCAKAEFWISNHVQYIYIYIVHCMVFLNTDFWISNIEKWYVHYTHWCTCTWRHFATCVNRFAEVRWFFFLIFTIPWYDTAPCTTILALPK